MLDSFSNSGILGLIQGLAEWLPISSTGRFKIAEHYLDLTSTPLFNLILHLGTLVAVIFYFRKEVRYILTALARLDFRTEYGKMIPLLIAGTMPAAIVGLIYVQFLEDTLQQLLVIEATFIVGVTLVYISKIGKENTDNVTYQIALIRGVAQGLAIFPGLSRSGATMQTCTLLHCLQFTRFVAFITHASATGRPEFVARWMEQFKEYCEKEKQNALQR